MRSRLSLSLFLVAILALTLAGCGAADAPPAQPDPEATTPSDEAVERAEDGAQEALTAAYEVGQPVTLEGQLGCGHCSFHVGERCSAAMKVAEGPIVILEVSEDHELFADRFSGKQIEVEGTVASIDDVGVHVDVASFTTKDS